MGGTEGCFGPGHDGTGHWRAAGCGPQQADGPIKAPLQLVLEVLVVPAVHIQCMTHRHLRFRRCCCTCPAQVLIADFFLVLFALGWLGAGVVLVSALGRPVSPLRCGPSTEVLAAMHAPAFHAFERARPVWAH